MFFDVEWEHAFLRLRFGEHYRWLHTNGLDEQRLTFYTLAMHLSLVAGPLRLLDGDFPDRDVHDGNRRAQPPAGPCLSCSFRSVACRDHASAGSGHHSGVLRRGFLPGIAEVGQADLARCRSAERRSRGRGGPRARCRSSRASPPPTPRSARRSRRCRAAAFQPSPVQGAIGAGRLDVAQRTLRRRARPRHCSRASFASFTASTMTVTPSANVKGECLHHDVGRRPVGWSRSTPLSTSRPPPDRPTAPAPEADVQLLGHGTLAGTGQATHHDQHGRNTSHTDPTKTIRRRGRVSPTSFERDIRRRRRGARRRGSRRRTSGRAPRTRLPSWATSTTWARASMVWAQPPGPNARGCRSRAQPWASRSRARGPGHEQRRPLRASVRDAACSVAGGDPQPGLQLVRGAARPPRRRPATRRGRARATSSVPRSRTVPGSVGSGTPRASPIAAAAAALGVHPQVDLGEERHLR